MRVRSFLLAALVGGVISAAFTEIFVLIFGLAAQSRLGDATFAVGMLLGILSLASVACSGILAVYIFRRLCSKAPDLTLIQGLFIGVLAGAIQSARFFVRSAFFGQSEATDPGVFGINLCLAILSSVGSVIALKFIWKVSTPTADHL